MPNGPYAALQLRTNPFSPDINISGQQLKFDYLQGPLTPQQNRVHLKYYFDLYRWSDPEYVGSIGRDGRISAFPEGFGQPGMIVVISGVSGTGRTSLENLLQFEITARADSEPLLTRYTIEVSSNKVQAAQNFATLFIQDIEDYLSKVKRAKEAKTLPKRLKAIMKEWRESLVPDEPNTDFLFQQLTREVRKILPKTPIVFSLDATNHINTPDTWRPACIMLRNLADFVILSLSNHDHASYLRTSLKDYQMRAVWIHAPRIDAAQTIRFLTARLLEERTANLEPGEELFPFTEGAVKALFAPAGGAGPITLSIGVAIKKLKGAFEKKCADIHVILANEPGVAIPAARLRITDADMQSYFSS